MKLPHRLHNNICNFLLNLPNIRSSSAQQAFLNSAGLDEDLDNQINIGGSPKEFIELVIPALTHYGKLEDGRYALVALLEAAKSCVGQDRKALCDMLVDEVQQWCLEYEATNEIKRAKLLTSLIEDFLSDEYKPGSHVTIRMRAAFTSMSNIGRMRDIQEKNDWLIKERDAIQQLLDKDCVRLKCICWPKLKFLSYYTEKEIAERVELLNSFLQDSLQHYRSRRQILCDRTGAKGNLLIIGHKVAIVAPPKSTEYTETIVFKNRQVVRTLIQEYDILFKHLLQAGKFAHLTSGEELHKGLIDDTIAMVLSQEKAG